MGGRRRIISGQLFCIDVVGLHIVKEQILIAVVDVEKRRPFLFSLQGQGEFGKKSVPRIVDHIDCDIGMYLFICLCYAAKHIFRCPDPPVDGNRIAVVYKVVGIVGHIFTHDVQTFVCLCILYSSGGSVSFTVSAGTSGERKQEDKGETDCQ